MLSTHKMELPSFKKDATKKEIAKLMAPIINDMCNQMLKGKDVGGVEAMQYQILDLLRRAGQSKDNQWYDVEMVGSHPDNREGSGVVPADVQDLLLIMFKAGFNPQLLKLIACEIADGETGEEWRRFNTQVANNSQGFLPPANADRMKIFTAAGTHTTSAMRCAKFGPTSAHAELGEDTISKAAIIEARPSFSEPIEKGMPYTVICKEIVELCPQLMYVLSRGGNASHGAERPHTALQQALAVFRASKVCVDWTEALSCASSGQNQKFDAWERLREFVTAHSGGESGKYLYELEKFERSLGSKRPLEGASLGALAKIQLQGPCAPRYVPAMVKAMLQAPECKTHAGFAELFSQNDINSVSKGGKNEKIALRATEIMVSAEKFCQAYAADSHDRLRNDFEIDLVWYVHSLKAPGKVHYKSLEHVALHFYEEVKKLELNLPVWPVIASLLKKPTASETGEKRKIRELTEDGTVPNEQLGFVENDVVTKGNASYVITDLSDPCMVTIRPEPRPKKKAKGEPEDDTIKISRFDLMTDYAKRKEETWVPLEYPSPADEFEFQSAIWKGLVKSAMQDAFEKSSEGKVCIQSKVLSDSKVSTTLRVVCVADASKLTLVAISNNIAFSKTPTESSTNICLGECIGHKVFIKSSNHYGVTDEQKRDIRQSDRSACLSAFWIVNRVDDFRAANMQSSTKDITIKGKQFKLPILVNTRPIKKGEELIIYKHPTTDLEIKAVFKGKGKGKKACAGRGKGK